MLLSYILNRFQFDNEPIINHQIRAIITNHYALVRDWNWMLLLNIESLGLQFHIQSVFVHFLQESRSKEVVDIITMFYHPSRHIIYIHYEYPSLLDMISKIDKHMTACSIF